jgi:hypothetical protein
MGIAGNHGSVDSHLRALLIQARGTFFGFEDEWGDAPIN